MPNIRYAVTIAVIATVSVSSPSEAQFQSDLLNDPDQIVDWVKNKNVLTQSRDAYAMVRAFQLTGDESYLSYARGALDFMYEHGWDKEFGGPYKDYDRITGQMKLWGLTDTTKAWWQM